jgi:tetratricopeptide (TPR) repeat protein
MALLAVALLAIPVMAEAQAGSSAARERDSLINLISRETSESRLAVLNYQLAEKYGRLGQYPKLMEAADKASIYANNCKDYATLHKANMLAGECYVMADDAVNAIQRYLSARDALERKFKEENRVNRERQREQGIPERDIKDLKQSDEERETIADITVKIGMVYFNRGHYIHAIDDFSDALVVYDELGVEEKSVNIKRHLAVSYYMRNDHDSALEYYEQLLEVYKERDDWEKTRMVYQRLNDIAIAKQDYDKALEYNRGLYNDCIAHNSVRESLNALNNVAYAYGCLGENEKAIKYYQQLLDTDPKVFGDERFMAGNYTNLGLCYQNIGDVDNAITCLRKAADLRKTYSQWLECSTVENIIARIYLNKGDLHNAEENAKLAVKDAETSGDSKAMEAAYQTYNDVLRQMDNYADALDYYQKYLSIKDSVERRKSDYEKKMSDDLKNLTDAAARYEQGISEQANKDLELENYRILAEAREKELDNLRKLNEMENARRAEEERRREIDFNNRLEMERLEREKQIQQNEIDKQRIQIYEKEQARLAEEQKNSELLLEQEKQARLLQQQQADATIMQYGLALAGVAIVGALIFIFVVRKKNSRLKAQQAEIAAKNETLQMKNDEILSFNQEITKQKAVIEEANKQMTDSIVYAKRIQTAVAPTPQFLSDANFDYFMFFRPRDIVSGDYYWFYQDHQRHLFIVAADCTGHGVPGAFMSMLGVSLFNKIVKERQVLQPNIILNEMRNEVKLALHQDSINSSQKDGMDLSLVRIDLDTMMMHFAAANNNGYLLQEFDESQREEISKDLAKPEHLREVGNGKLLKLTIMPADPMPIGVYLREKESFTMTSYQLRKGDSFILSSDGYVDQFGGKYGRKFLSRNFIKLLMDMYDKPMEAQKEVLIDTHEKWRGLEYDQLDDIIVIGVRV